MLELGRVICNRRYVVVFILLFLANIMLFQKEQSGTLAILQSEEDARYFVYELQESERQRQSEFYERINNIAANKEQMLEFDMFADENSYAYKNIMKTERDYDIIKDVRLSDINDYALDSFFEYKGLYIIALLIVVYTVVSYIDERKCGLWQVINVCSRARGMLAFKRLLILYGVSLVTSLVFVVSTLLVSFADYGGSTILFASVQSVCRLQGVMMNISLLAFLVYYVFIMSLVLSVSGVVIWLILSVVRNRYLAVLVCICIYGVELLLYNSLSPSGSAAILRYANLYMILDPREVFLNYHNFTFCGMVVNTREFLELLVGILLICGAVLVILINNTLRPDSNHGRLGVVAGYCMSRIRRIRYYLGGFGNELCKFMIDMKGIVVIVIYIIMAVYSIDTTELAISPARQMLDDFYVSNTGPVVMHETEFGQIENEAQKLYSEGYDAEHNAMCGMYEMLSEQKVYAQELEARGIDGWYINGRGYEMLVTGNDYLKTILAGLGIMIAVIYIAVAALSYEYEQGMKMLIASTPGGNRCVFIRKIICVMSMVVAFDLIWLGARLYEVKLRYMLAGISAPVQNLEMFGNSGLRISIGGMLGILYAAKFVLHILTAANAMYISVKLKSSGKTYAVSLVLLVFGLAEALLGNLASLYGLWIPLSILIAGIVLALVCVIRTYSVWVR